MNRLSPRESLIHQEGLSLAKQYSRIEFKLIEILILVDQTKLYRKIDKRSVFTYAIDIWGLGEAVAYNLITVSRAAAQVPALRKALRAQRLTAYKAGRIAAHVAEHEYLIEFAATHTTREIGFEVAKLNGRVDVHDKIKVLSENQVQITLTVDRETFEKFERAQALLAQRDLPSSLSDVASESVREFVERHDPVRKAERSLRVRRVKGKKTRKGQSQRAPLTAEQKHQVFLRDQGKCTHKNASGTRCNSDWWIDVHHIIRVCDGGTNDPENLTTLCGFHHSLLHRNGRRRDSTSHIWWDDRVDP